MKQIKDKINISHHMRIPSRNVGITIKKTIAFNLFKSFILDIKINKQLDSGSRALASSTRFHTGEVPSK